MDIITYALCKKRLDNVTLAYSYKGAAASVSDLPASATLGDLYTVGSTQYVWNGTSWIEVGGVITNAEIDTIME